MTDYWVSKERHYCRYCNAWMQGDKNSIRHHEQSGRHKGMVEAELKKKRKEKSNAVHAERDLQQQLREIEQAAQARFAQDMASSGAPPPPPPRPGRPAPGLAGPRSKGDGQGRDYDPSRHAHAPEEETIEPPKQDDRGIYMVRGSVYLEGKRHEEQLVVGSACQIWVEEADEWLDALIEKAVVHRVPNTELTFRRFSITYMSPMANAPVTETELLADRLRIRLPDVMTIEDAERMIQKVESGEAETIEEAHIPVDETTGMGEWSTVVIHEIDESEEAVAQRQAEAELAEAKQAEEEKRREALEDFSGQGDDALGAFNPWGGSYKGIELDAESASSRKAREEEIMIQTDGDVGFKKRKTNDSTGSQDKKKKKQRRIRTEDDD
ncbi:hypothetical protein Poli38472_003019 [Pythium oligandrum]|uniref:U1-C C2H2-type zinc finger domain-containing protein n=1 Tax=Pythium oligandrum TaxID=41045 RepID=A0A8K1C605_PYTOL|nr:hypothetical protein Poli38472_003019 [Pythium oligandrum]|eukprot:TMW57094.1 hypothetical protein Poli38472_003019 [Pythium oligandrum]